MTELNTSLVELDQQLCFMLYSTSRAMTKAYQPMLQDLEITYPQYLVLMVMWQWQREHHTNATVSALCEKLLLDSGTVTPLLKRMEAAGLVVRQRSTEDERKVLISLTSKATGLHEKALAWTIEARRRSSFKAEEVDNLRTGLSKLLGKLQGQ